LIHGNKLLNFSSIIMNISSEIIEWYLANKRDLPWRNTKDPYKIWMSEIILQQTKVEQGLSYYHKLISNFPTVQDLAVADEETILKNWQGLGYYSRARNLHFAAKQITKDFDNNFPNTYEDIISLKGVGEYTAAAIASFAFQLPYAVVDGNVFRLLSRFFGVDTPINSSEGKKIFSKLAQTHLDTKRPDTYNQAIMEFGSQMCKPKNPECIRCPLQSTCIAFSENKIQDLPVKLKKTKQKVLHFDYFYIRFKNETFIKKRLDNGIWKNLYEFPLIDSEKELSEKDVLKKAEDQGWLNFNTSEIKSISKKYKHILSHRIIYARFWEIKSRQTPTINSVSKIRIENISEYPVSRLIEKFLEENILNNNQ
jgi:A/G-specific adenine glycosylase